MARRVVDLHPEAIAEGREARNWYRERSRDVEERLIVGKILGHADLDVTGRYDAHAYDREKREALVKWTAELLRIVAGKKRTRQSKVLPWAR